MAGGRVGRFAGAVERQLLDLIRSHPLRLAVLTLATLIAYASMAAEAWIIMRAANVPISFAGALAVETFSRVASFASAFIPANLGALEASSIAAVTAVGAAAAGAPLALARRLRGLFWAGIGLAIYPGARAAACAGLDPPLHPDGRRGRGIGIYAHRRTADCGTRASLCVPGGLLARVRARRWKRRKRRAPPGARSQE